MITLKENFIILADIVDEARLRHIFFLFVNLCLQNTTKVVNSVLVC